MTKLAGLVLIGSGLAAGLLLVGLKAMIDLKRHHRRRPELWKSFDRRKPVRAWPRKAPQTW